MGLFTKLSRVFGSAPAPKASGKGRAPSGSASPRGYEEPGFVPANGRPAHPTHPTRPPHARRSVGVADIDDRADIAALLGDEPVRIHLDDERSPGRETDEEIDILDEASAQAFDAGTPSNTPVTPRNKQELLTELRKNYSEMVGLIRKVDGHLDEQQQRSARLLEIAEGIPGALAALPDLRDRMGELNASIRQLAETVTSTGARSDEFSAAQVDAIREVRTILERSGEVEEGIATSLERFNSTLTGMNSATSDLSKAMRTIQERQDQREDRLADALAGSQRWMVWILGLCGVGVLAAIVIGIVALVR